MTWGAQAAKQSPRGDERDHRSTGVSPGYVRGAWTGTTQDCGQKTGGGAPPLPALPGRAPGSAFPGVRSHFIDLSDGER